MDKIMPEPISSGATSVLYYYLAAYGIGATFAAIIVMAFMKPRSAGELFACLVCTVISSFSLGTYLSWKWGFVEAATQNPIMFVPALGIAFASGMPAWVLVRTFFTFAGDKENTTKLLDEILVRLVKK